MQKGAIFDMDGLLINSEQNYQKAWIFTAEIYKKPRGVELSKIVSGTGMENCKKNIREFYPDVNVDEFFDKVVETGRKFISENFAVMPGVEDILKFFKKNNVKTAVASSSDVETIKNDLTRGKILNYFDVIVDGKQIKNGKPAPDIFIKAAEMIKIPPNNCYVFEDSFNGIRGAKSANCIPIMIPDTIQPTEEIKKLCAGIYPTLIEALKAIRENKI